ncbi:MAG: polysaccharide deacetylase family protein [candidate division KSB1 bacterium]|nr:polysaccharide deacetylase family protein [candidate division KSB1 bacterium]
MNHIKLIIRNLLGGIFAAGLMLFGVYRRAKRRAMTQPQVTPLFFHTIGKDLFRKCMLWLKKNGYVFISTDELVEIIKHRRPMPPKAVWITFDDGWKENMDTVIPVIVELNIPVTFFISTDPVEHSGVFWWSYVTRYGRYLPAAYNNLKKLQAIDEKRRRELIENLEAKFNGRLKREAMEVKDVISLASKPQITIGCHTAHHVVMSNCTDEQLAQEIIASRQKLEEWTGKSIIYFCYPDGFFNDHVKEIVKRHGFELAASTENRYITGQEDPFSMPRFWVRGEGFLAEAKCQMLGIWVPFMWKLQKWLDIDSNLETMFQSISKTLAEYF